jgi:divalent metal cation (Fe/Co/Zn/Cd) transporter
MAHPFLAQTTTRSGHIRLGVGIELVTIVWMTIEASVALSVGFMTRSVSLQGFGIDSIIELIAGGILLWRLLIEQRGGSVEVVEHAERRASWVTAIGLFALAAYIVADSAFSFLTQTKPEASWWGVWLAIAAVMIMPLLWQGMFLTVQ